jgi:hypothetical protein
MTKYRVVKKGKGTHRIKKSNKKSRTNLIKRILRGQRGRTKNA